MDIQVDITENFKKEFKELTERTQIILTEKINALIGQLQSGCQSKLYRVKGLEFPPNINPKKSTLYLYRATPDFRIILSLDNNPLQNNKILTLYKLTNHKNMSVCFMAIAKKLYE